ncbi:hypothetical protein [Phosphitispora sp. TUW77]|uniref:hypothetical protein n=1 Tax=Phosphitispora sp. TUW77 TaxID=3152361 RepID=UPI003AB368FF
MDYLLFVIPVVVILFEYMAVNMALAYARFAMAIDRPVVELLFGILKIGDNLAYDAVPDTVLVLNLLALLLSLMYLAYFFLYILPRKQSEICISPQED